MKKASEILKGVHDFSYVKKCIHCGGKVKGYKTHYSKDKKVKLIRPIFSCDCIEKAQAKKVESEKQNIILSLMQNSNIDKDFRVNEYPVHHAGIKEYYDNLDWIKLGKQLLIYGAPGNHKTGHITMIMKKAIREKQYSCLYYRASELPRLCKDENKIKYNAIKCDLLVLDNFAKEESEKFGGINFDIIDKRIHRHRACILILNFDDDSRVEKIYQSPMSSRLNGFTQIPMTGRDKREDITYGESKE